MPKNRIAGNHTISKEGLQLGRLIATKDNRSFSNFLDWLIKEEAKRRNLVKSFSEEDKKIIKNDSFSGVLKRNNTEHP